MKKILLIVTLFSLLSCATSRESQLKKVRVGMSKDKVLDLVGDPSRSSRITGADRWSYDYWVGESKKTLNIHFVEGAVTSITDDNQAAPTKEGFRPIGK